MYTKHISATEGSKPQVARCLYTHATVYSLKLEQDSSLAHYVLFCMQGHTCYTYREYSTGEHVESSSMYMYLLLAP